MSSVKQAHIADWLGEQLVHRIELEGMLAANQQRISCNESIAYPESEFTQLRDEVARSNNYHSNAVRGAE